MLVRIINYPKISDGFMETTIECERVMLHMRRSDNAIILNLVVVGDTCETEIIEIDKQTMKIYVFDATGKMVEVYE